ncbi:hypothetical protein [uncultured Caulobacter sp.]|uniref:hypothetical protein n=1 Tax=uncultured Caulobacter sp. TaxID=158749 RepID=UPI0026359D2F|nr:hypothetical protein [uncultured Caulobacter sp.]
MLMILGIAVAAGPVMAQPTARAEAAMEPRPGACAPEANVDSCWRAGVKAERRGDARAALAAYEASCAAGLQIGGCYEAGKIYFLNLSLRDYGKSKDRMTPVCEGTDPGIGPYACKFLGIIHRKGLAGEASAERAFDYLSRSCFPRGEPFIDGNGCEILADNVPGADAMRVDDEVWNPGYIAYLALAMGCSDDMPALCARAQALHRKAIAQSARWLARCVEDAAAVGFSGRCEAVVQSARAADYEQRQTFRRRLVRMFHLATDYAG